MSGGRRSNGEGSVLYDKRRKKPYRARVTVGWAFDEKTGKNKQITKDLGSYRTKGEATAALAEYFDDPYNLENKDITFSELYKMWYDDFIGDHASNRNRVRAAYKYCSTLYNKKMKDITILDMKNCIYNGYVIPRQGRNKGKKHLASPSTKESIKYIFNHMYAYAVEARIVKRNYAKDFSLDKKVEQEKKANHKETVPFSEEQLQKLWKSIDFVPFADIVVYNCYSGWRPSELVGLRVADVDWEQGFIKGGIKTDAGKDRLVPIHPLVKDIVRKYYDEAVSIGSEYLFNDTTKRIPKIGFNYGQYAVRFYNVMRSLGFGNEFVPKSPRHTFVTRAKARKVGMNEYVLKRIVGHKIDDVTENVYTHRDISELKEEMELIKD